MTEGVDSPVSTVPGSAPDRNLALELVRVTEAAALAAGRYVGRGDKEAADQAAVDAMRHMLRASPPRVEEALEALADVAQSARDAASFLAVIRRSIREAEAASTAAADRAG